MDNYLDFYPRASVISHYYQIIFNLCVVLNLPSHTWSPLFYHSIIFFLLLFFSYMVWVVYFLLYAKVYIFLRGSWKFVFAKIIFCGVDMPDVITWTISQKALEVVSITFSPWHCLCQGHSSEGMEEIVWAWMRAWTWNGTPVKLKLWLISSLFRICSHDLFPAKSS